MAWPAGCEQSCVTDANPDLPARLCEKGPAGDSLVRQRGIPHAASSSWTSARPYGKRAARRIRHACACLSLLAPAAPATGLVMGLAVCGADLPCKRSPPRQLSTRGHVCDGKRHGGRRDAVPLPTRFSTLLLTTWPWDFPRPRSPHTAGPDARGTSSPSAAA
ncbi:hypothetical protein BJ546DRAFT_405085 [Cryomyces antarcticus]